MKNIFRKLVSMRKQRETRPLSVGELEQIAVNLEHYASRYRALAEQMTAKSIETIDAANMKTLDRSIEFIKKALSKAYEAYDQAATAVKIKQEIVGKLTTKSQKTKDPKQ